MMIILDGAGPGLVQPWTLESARRLGRDSEHQTRVKRLDSERVSLEP